MSDANWLPDPSGRHELRYWDGTTWTDHISDQGVTGTDPAGNLSPPGKSGVGWRDKAKAAAAKGQEVAKAKLDERQAEKEATAAGTASRPAPAPAPVTSGEPVLRTTSHEEGRNATVLVYADRIERDRAKKLSSLSRAKQETEVIPMRSVSSVQAKKDGMMYTKVTVHATGNPIEFRMPHAAAQQFKDAITRLLLAGPAPTPSAPAAPSLAAQIKELAELRDQGILSEDEFQAQKAKLLT